MKKIVAIILLAALLACCTAAVAFAETQEQRIVSLATKHDKVTDAKCVVYKRICLLAIKTEKFNTKSEYDKYVEELSNQITSQFEVDKVFVTRSPKAMFKLNELSKLSEEQRQKEIEEMIKRELDRRDHDIKHVPPKMLNAFC